MDIDHIKLQYARLARHHSRALNDKDQISFLDLAHTLRIWVDMKSCIDDLAKEKDVTLGLSNYSTPKEVKTILKSKKYTYLPLASSVDSPEIKVKGIGVVNCILSPEEGKKLYEAGPPEAQISNLSFSEWLASGVCEVSSKNKQHPSLNISRTIIIKRVANILGASHPAGTENADAMENKFDEYVMDLHEIQLAGYPATYYELLEIANEILEKTKCLFISKPNTSLQEKAKRG